MLKKLTSECFVPIAAGGGVRSCEDARLLLRSGADKVVLNSIIYKDYNMVKIIAKEFGQQCVIGSIDLMDENDAHSVLINNGTEKDSKFNLSWIYDDYVGEVYLNSINRDGTGQGYDFSTLNEIPKDCKLPIILAGGVGNPAHLKEGLSNQRVDAVATAHLFNFIGNGLQNARNSIIASKIPLAKWPPLNKNYRIEMSDKVLIIGAGSMGLKYADVIKKLQPSSEIYLYKRAGSLRNLSNINGVFNCLDKCIELKPKHTIIACPAIHHLEYAKLFLENFY